MNAGLLALALHHADWLRCIETWLTERANPWPTFTSLAHHLFAKYPVPPFMTSVWFELPERPLHLPEFKEDPRLRSGLALAGANRWKERSERGQSDGLLTALEVENLSLFGTDLVVLSACETGLGEVQVGEGVLGLRRAFQAAGAQTVIASLWKVPDKETVKLMSRFMELWLAGKPKVEALRQAQLELLAEMRKEDDPRRWKAPPRYWAGFICHGQPE